MKKKVYVCAPWEDLDKVREYVRYALKSGVAPVAPQYYQLALDMTIPEERKEGKTAGVSLLWFCDEVWVFGEEITEAMKDVIDFSKNMKLKIRTIRLSDVQKVIGGKRK